MGPLSVRLGVYLLSTGVNQCSRLATKTFLIRGVVRTKVDIPPPGYKPCTARGSTLVKRHLTPLPGPRVESL